jgi:heat shock protein HslJ
VKALLAVVGLALLASAAGCGGGSDVSDLQNTPWVLTSGRGITLPAGVAPSAAFLDTGQMAGSGGCNRFTAPYTVDGDALSVGQLAGTQMSCSPVRNTIELAYVTALGRVRTWAKDGDELVLSDANGDELLRFKVATLVGAWKVTGLYANNAISSPIAGTELTAVFTDGGSLTGSAGCNTYTTSYTADTGDIQIEPAAATKKLCTEPKGIMEQEAAYLAALEAAATYGFDGATMGFSDSEGQKLATFTRAQP